MSEPVWLSRDLVVAFHKEQLEAFGGPPGIRDEVMLESALGRPVNKWAYGETDLAVLSAAYAYGIARNHPFVDGNKRAAFLSIVVFLDLNGIEFDARNEDVVQTILALAAGNLDEDALAAWIGDHWPPGAARSLS